MPPVTRQRGAREVTSTNGVRLPATLRCVQIAVALLVLACRPGANGGTISPGDWPPDEMTVLWERNRTYGVHQPEVQSRRGMVAATTDPIAIHAGVEVLRRGGTALDALITTSLAQITLEAGSGVSFAGQMTLLYYEAATGTVHGIDGSFDTVRDETDPMSIPSVDSLSGRAVLVPGLMAGFEAAHRRFGRLPFTTLLLPATYFAEHGFVVDSRLASRLQTRAERLNRLPATRRVFSRPDGALLAEGDTLRQPELAATLRQVGEQGVAYLYQGAWGAALVDTVRAYGGRLAVEDLRDYRPAWATPVETTFRGEYRIVGPGSPSFGGTSMAEAFNLLELADLRRVGHYRESPAALATMLAVSQVGELVGQPMAGSAVSPKVLATHFPGIDLSPAARITKDHARMLWARMTGPEWPAFRADAMADRMRGSELIEKLLSGWGRRRPQRTAGVVAIDELGNVAAVMHSINSSYWGTGLMVGGIAIPDPGGFQQYLIASVGPGVKLPEPDNPLIVLRDGKPVLAASGVGAGLHEVAIQGILDVLDFGMTPAEAVLMPSLRKNWPLGHPLRLPVGTDGFPDSTLQGLRRLGVDVEIVMTGANASPAGMWVAIGIDPKTGIRRSGLTRGLNGAAEGY
jgi:gamma-glutamyltranspeptidase/glutathione hydrolase